MKFKKSQIEAATEKALAVANSRYHSWPAKRQERTRAKRDERARNLIRRVLLKELLEIECSTKDLKQTWDEVSGDERVALDWAESVTRGIGNDYISINDSCAPRGKNLLDFTTVYDYDRAFHEDQELMRMEGMMYYTPIDYLPLGMSINLQMPRRSGLRRGKFVSLVDHYRDTLHKHMFEVISQLIPNKYVEGEDHGQESPDNSEFVLLDLQLEAGGLEGQLETLYQRQDQYICERWSALFKTFEAEPPATYCLGDEDDWEEDLLFIAHNIETLRRVRWRNFCSDCWDMIGDYEAAMSRMDEEKKMAEEFVNAAYKDIMENFDPSIPIDPGSGLARHYIVTKDLDPVDNKKVIH